MSGCSRFEEATRREDPGAWRAFLAHASGCADCREELAAWEAISRAAPSLKKEWDSPRLWPRIEAAMAQQPSHAAVPVSPERRRFSWVPLAAAAALFVIAAVGLQVLGPTVTTPLTPRSMKDPLLEENTLAEVEKSEKEYVASIGRLSKLAEPRLSQSDSPLFISYREKITLLDSAIGDLRAQVDQNRYNTHLRRELLAVYREKQHTLEQVVREAKS
ncbi:MAG TPA: hypothetical protein VK780_02695 [Thermoanaerobaculia bacterium]|nr:hypothetical protein [Thermoanaerobaculia bacterium]